LSIQGELHFKGVNEGAVFTILSLERRTSDGINDNKYRDEIILRYADTTSRLWTINRLPMEHYLWGIAETSNISPIDYIKSIIVASRTYALYHYLNPYKYNGYFTLKATTADQLYRGYNSELRRPRVVQAAKETKGEVVTYGDDIVVTPYFGHSDGKTRNWSSVFGGKDKAWIQPVVAPYDAGRAMWGHGVGMSANDAYGHAKIDRWGYVKIIKYYYNGIEVSKVY
jgi:stage II sporulation protein D